MQNKSPIFQNVTDFTKSNSQSFEIFRHRFIDRIFFRLLGFGGIYLTFFLLATLVNFEYFKDSFFLYPYLPAFATIIAYFIIRFFKTSIYEHSQILVLLIHQIIGAGVCFIVHKINMTPNALVLVLFMTSNYFMLYPSRVKRILAIIAVNGALFSGLMLAAPLIAYEKIMEAISGIILGQSFSVLILFTVKFLFYLKETESSAKQHAYSEMEKMLYPHQMSRIITGDRLEETMPHGEKVAIALTIDVTNSTKIPMRVRGQFIEELMSYIHQLARDRYQEIPLASNAYVLKDLGDGLILTVGYPFEASDGNKLNTCVSMILKIVPHFIQLHQKFKLEDHIKLSIGAAGGPIRGRYSQHSIHSYDCFGSAIDLSTRYEEIRKISMIADLYKTDYYFVALQAALLKNYKIDASYKDQLKIIHLPDNLRIRNEKNADCFYTLQIKY